ncbi:MAG: hypothetical protein ACFFD4_26355 [Candidatus Odinarchaeota archaeon]
MSHPRPFINLLYADSNLANHITFRNFVSENSLQLDCWFASSVTEARDILKSEKIVVVVSKDSFQDGTVDDLASELDNTIVILLVNFERMNDALKTFRKVTNFIITNKCDFKYSKSHHGILFQIIDMAIHRVSRREEDTFDRDIPSNLSTLSESAESVNNKLAGLLKKTTNWAFNDEETLITSVHRHIDRSIFCLEPRGIKILLWPRSDLLNLEKELYEVSLITIGVQFSATLGSSAAVKDQDLKIKDHYSGAAVLPVPLLTDISAVVVSTTICDPDLSDPRNKNLNWCLFVLFYDEKISGYIPSKKDVEKIIQEHLSEVRTIRDLEDGKVFDQAINEIILEGWRDSSKSKRITKLKTAM